MTHPGSWCVEEENKERKECTSKFKSFKAYMQLGKKVLFRQLALGENGLYLGKLLTQLLGI